MLGKSLASVGMPELQKAVMGMDPRIKPFEALAELQTRVKREKMKQSMQAQNPQQQPVAQQALAEAASLQNPYMSGLGGAPVESPVGMAGGGIVAFQEGGDVPGFQAGVYIPQEFDNTIVGLEAGDLYAQAMAKIKAGKPLSPKEAAVVNQGAAGTKSEPPRSRNIDMPAAFDNTISGFQPGNRYAEEMAKIKAKEDEAKNRPLSGQEKALITASGPLAAVGDLALSPVNLVRNALRNPLDKSERPSMTPMLDARKRAMDTFMPNAEKTSSRSQRPEYDAATQERGTAALEAMRDIQTGSEAGASGNAAAGLAGAAAARGAGAGGSGRAGTGAAGVGLGSIPSAYDTGFTPQTDDERIASMMKYKKAMGAQNEEFLAPIKDRLAQYEKEAADQKRYAIPDALVQAGLGMMAGKSQYALQNIGEGGAAGLAALRESRKLDRAAQDKLLQANADMAKSRIALEKGDEQTAASLANQARQEQQAGAQFKLLGQHYANQDRASQLQAQAYLARANALGGADKSALTQFQAGKLADMAGDNVQKFMDSSAGMQALITARAEAKSAGVPFDAMKFRSDLVQREMQRLQQTMSNGTMPAQASLTGGPNLAEADLALINKYMR